MDSKTTRPGGALQGVGHLPAFLPALESNKGSHSSASESGPSSTQPVSTESRPQDQSYEWPAQNLNLLAVGRPPPIMIDMEARADET